MERSVDSGSSLGISVASLCVAGAIGAAVSAGIILSASYLSSSAHNRSLLRRLPGRIGDSKQPDATCCCSCGRCCRSSESIHHDNFKVTQLEDGGVAGSEPLFEQSRTIGIDNSYSRSRITMSRADDGQASCGRDAFGGCAEEQQVSPSSNLTARELPQDRSGVQCGKEVPLSPLQNTRQWTVQSCTSLNSSDCEREGDGAMVQSDSSGGNGGRETGCKPDPYSPMKRHG